jgi:hypothetical protein
MQADLAAASAQMCVGPDGSQDLQTPAQHHGLPGSAADPSSNRWRPTAIARCRSIPQPATLGNVEGE